MKNILHRTWRIVRIPLGVLLLLYIGLVVYRIPAGFERMKTEETVARIHAAKLTLADVTGENLPPAPDPALADATVEGIDVNGNGIRDDVELAIFKLYPNSARIRAAELQYAKALQMELVEVFNSETLVAGIQEEDRAFFCVGDVFKNQSNFNTEIARVESLTLNIELRKMKYKDIYKKYMTSYGDIEGKSNCDINLGPLQN